MKTYFVGYIIAYYHSENIFAIRNWLIGYSYGLPIPCIKSKLLVIYNHIHLHIQLHKLTHIKKWDQHTQCVMCVSPFLM